MAYQKTSEKVAKRRIAIMERTLVRYQAELLKYGMDGAIDPALCDSARSCMVSLKLILHATRTK